MFRPASKLCCCWLLLTPTGKSLGGMHAWLAGVLDDRISVVAPVIGVQVGGWVGGARRG
jgi:hypothetical protein